MLAILVFGCNRGRSNTEMAWQKLDYLHFNLVEAEFRSEQEESSARDYAGKKGL